MPWKKKCAAPEEPREKLSTRKERTTLRARAAHAVRNGTRGATMIKMWLHPSNFLRLRRAYSYTQTTRAAATLYLYPADSQKLYAIRYTAPQTSERRRMGEGRRPNPQVSQMCVKKEKGEGAFTKS